MLESLVDELTKIGNAIIDRSPVIFIGMVLFLFFLLLGSFLRKTVKKRLASRIADKLLLNFIGRVVYLIFFVIGIVIFLNQIGLGKAAGGLLAGAGVSAIILGFAFKDIGENFLAGFFLAFSRPFSIGDVIEVSGLIGTVKALNFRNTHLRTFDGKDIFMPNAMLIKNPLINYTKDGLLRHDFIVGIDYGDNISNAVKTILSCLSGESRIEQNGELTPFVQIDEFATSTINIRIFYWINSYDFTGSIPFLKTEVMKQVVAALLESGFSLPADILELKIYQEGQPIPVTLSDLRAKPNQ